MGGCFDGLDLDSAPVENPSSGIHRIRPPYASWSGQAQYRSVVICCLDTTVGAGKHLKVGHESSNPDIELAGYARVRLHITRIKRI